MLAAIYRRGTLLSIATLVICLLGVIAALRVPIQMIPDLDVRVITVRTDWAGATPQDVEREILIEQEEYLRSVPGVRRMESTAQMGQAVIELEFPFGIDLNQALIRVNNALSQVPDYPENVDEPRLYANSFSQNAFMHFTVTPLPGNPQGLDMNMQRDFIDDFVRPRMERVAGVEQVDVRGGAQRQVQIFVDAARLAERRISYTELRDAIRQRNRDRSGGDLDAGKRRYLVRTIGRFESLQDLENMVVARRGDAVIRLSDVAVVRLHHFERRGVARSNGQPSIMVAVQRETGSNVIAIKRAMLPAVDALRREVLEPAGMTITLMNDDVRYVEESVANVWRNLMLGAVLAMGVMYAFLRSGRATLIAVVGVPVCTIAAFIGLLLAGRTINVISLAGVAFAIGMTLDNTIVVLESIERERRRGLSAFDAAVSGASQVWSAVLASTLTTILVFMPVLFVQQEAGQLYSDIAIAISASILCSMLVAITLVPALAARMPLGDGDGHGHGGTRLIRGIGWILARPRRRYASMAVTVLGTFAVIAWMTPPAEYLPEGEEPKTFSSMIAPAGYNMTTMNAISEQLEAVFLPHVGADRGPFERGETPIPPMQGLMMFTQPQSVRIISATSEPGDVGALMDAIDAEYRRYPGMRAFSSRGSIISSNDGGTRSVNVDVSGPDLAAVYAAADAVYQRASAVIPEARIGSEPSSLVLAQPLLELRPQWERLAEAGLSAADFGYMVAALTDGAYVDEFLLHDDKIDMFLYSNAGSFQDLAALPQMPVDTPLAGVLPLSSLAALQDTVDTDTVRRIDGRRTVTLNIIPPRTLALETAVGLVQAEVVDYLAREGHFEPGVSLDISGAADQLDATREALSGNFLVAVALSYLLLVAIFTHWGRPLLIMITVPLGIAGGIVGLWLLNVVGGPLAGITQPFDMITMLGFLILLGTVVNNPILIVERTFTQRDRGMSAEDAVRDAVASRLRPILMSTITTVCGLAPLVLIPGAGTELYRGLGAIVLFGLLFATAVTLGFLPALLLTVLNCTGVATGKSAQAAAR